jgi:hypothetical protein
MEGYEEIELYYSTLMQGVYFVEKGKLEMLLYRTFPQLSPDQSYSTIFYRRFLRETVE